MTDPTAITVAVSGTVDVYVPLEAMPYVVGVLVAVLVLAGVLAWVVTRWRLERKST